MTKVFPTPGNDLFNLMDTIKHLSDRVTTQGQTTSDAFEDDGDTIIIGDNTTYHQANVIVSDNQPTGLNSSTDVGTLWHNTSTDPAVVKWWDGFVFQTFTVGQNYRGGIGLDALGPAVVFAGQTNLRIYYQAAAPASPVVNRLWKNSTTGELQRYNGTAWSVVTDTNIQDAVTAALTAPGVDLTDNYIAVYYQATPPASQTPSDAGNLWYDTDDAYKAYTYHHPTTSWVDYTGDVRYTPGVSDGLPPPYSPTPSVLAGFGTYYITWDEVPNADDVMYDVYASQTSPVTINVGNQLGSTAGTFFFTNMNPAGAAYGDGQTWYFAVVARDIDGSAPASASTSGGVVRQQIVRTQITDDAIDTPQLNAYAVTADIVAANAIYTLAIQTDAVKAGQIDATGAITTKHTLTGPTIQTAAGGERIVIRNDGSGGIIESYSGLAGESPGYIDPNVLGGIWPQMKLAPGTTPTYTERPFIRMTSGATNGSEMEMVASDILLRHSAVTGSIELFDNFGVAHILLEGGVLHIGDDWGAVTPTDIFIGDTTTDISFAGPMYANAGLDITASGLGVSGGATISGGGSWTGGPTIGSPTITGGISGMGRQLSAWDFGTKSGNTDGNGDIVVSEHNAGSADVIFCAGADLGGQGRIYTVISKGNGTFTVRVYRADTNALVTSAAVSFHWLALRA